MKKIVILVLLIFITGIKCSEIGDDAPFMENNSIFVVRLAYDQGISKILFSVIYVNDPEGMDWRCAKLYSAELNNSQIVSIEELPLKINNIEFLRGIILSPDLSYEAVIHKNTLSSSWDESEKPDWITYRNSGTAWNTSPLGVHTMLSLPYNTEFAVKNIESGEWGVLLPYWSEEGKLEIGKFDTGGWEFQVPISIFYVSVKLTTKDSCYYAAGTYWDGIEESQSPPDDRSPDELKTLGVRISVISEGEIIKTTDIPQEDFASGDEILNPRVLGIQIDSSERIHIIFTTTNLANEEEGASGYTTCPTYKVFHAIIDGESVQINEIESLRGDETGYCISKSAKMLFINNKLHLFYSSFHELIHGTYNGSDWSFSEIASFSDRNMFRFGDVMIDESGDFAIVWSEAAKDHPDTIIWRGILKFLLMKDGKWGPEVTVFDPGDVTY